MRPSPTCALLALPLLLTAAAPPAPQGTAGTAPPMLLRQLVSDGMDRYARVHVPAGWDGVSPLPVVLAFHGGGGNAVQFADHTRMDLTADREGFLLVYPEGTGPLSAFGRFRLQTWNVGNCCGWAEENAIDDVRFVRDLLAALGQEWPLDRDHVYATGHSNGGMMSYRLAMEAPDLVAAIAPNAASLGLDGMPPSPVPILALHGKLDTNVPVAGGVGTGVSGVAFKSQKASLAPFAAVNLTLPPVLAETRGQALRYEAAAPGTGAPIHYWFLLDGAHSWPGHDGPRWRAVNRDIDANDEIWSFFSRF
jgi:polyhydroxybutyrate depolymerase